jgi:hypothetical protein
MKDGLVEDMSWGDYCAVEALNFSRLKPMMRSPLAYKWALDNPQEDTPATLLGTWTHRMILEPNRLGEFAVWGDEPFQEARRGRAWDKFCAVQDGKTIITSKERDHMVGIAVAVRQSPVAGKYLKDKGPTEVSMFWHDDAGRAFKGRIDKLIPRTHTMANLKTTRSSEPHQFGAQAYKLGYHMHEALYWDGYRTLTGTAPKQKIIAFESKAPYEGAVYRITPDVRLQGLEDLQALLDRLAFCEKHNTWPPEMDEESDLILPSYAISEESELAETELTTEEGE